MRQVLLPSAVLLVGFLLGHALAAFAAKGLEPLVPWSSSRTYSLVFVVGLGMALSMSQKFADPSTSDWRIFDFVIVACLAVVLTPAPYNMGASSVLVVSLTAVYLFARAGIERFWLVH